MNETPQKSSLVGRCVIGVAPGTYTSVINHTRLRGADLQLDEYNPDKL